jgi:heat shock protein HslJ
VSLLWVADARSKYKVLPYATLSPTLALHKKYKGYKTQGLHAPTAAVCSLNIRGGMRVLSGLGGCNLWAAAHKGPPDAIMCPSSGELIVSI